MARQRMIGLLVFAAAAATAFTGPASGSDRDRPLVFGVNRVGDPTVLYNPPDYDEHIYQRVREAGGTCVAG